MKAEAPRTPAAAPEEPPKKNNRRRIILMASVPVLLVQSARIVSRLDANVSGAMARVDRKGIDGAVESSLNGWPDSASLGWNR